MPFKLPHCWRQTALRAGIAVYGLFWAGGVVSYVALGGPPPDTAWAAPFFLALAAALTLALSPRAEWRFLAAAAAVGFASEWLGVATGFPFGAYEYTDALFPRVFGVPLVMTAAWMVLVAYARQVSAAPWIAAAWMTAMDLVIDPLAANALGFWQWASPGPYHGIPWSNFAGWYGVSLVVFLLDRRHPQPNPPLRRLGLSVFQFFTAIALALRLWGPAALGLSLLLAHVVRFHRPARQSARSTPPGPPPSPAR